MTAITGYWRIGDGLEPAAACDRMMAAQRAYGDDRSDRLAAGEIAVGRGLCALLPEDAADRQPLQGAGGGLVLVADARIDNRSELIEALGLAQPGSLADADIMLRAFERWGENALARFVGDWALALWDVRERRLLLARDGLGMAPLHYRRTKSFVAFASMPSGLLALATERPAPDLVAAGAFLADLPRDGPASYFEGIRRVCPGEAIWFTTSGERHWTHWRATRGKSEARSLDEMAEALRAQLDEAVASRLRRNGGAVASHLSGGYDSAAVAATAARLLAPSGDRLIAFTAAPRLGYAGPVPAGRVADESPAAAAVARRHANIDHVLLRPPVGERPFAGLSEKHALVQSPAGHLCNDLWWREASHEAGRRGARVMLTGQFGNYGLSAGGVQQLADLLGEGEWAEWLRSARALAGKGMGWREILNSSFGGWLPVGLHAWLRRAAGRAPPAEPVLAAPAWREELERAIARETALPPPPDSFAFRATMLARSDAGNFRKLSLALRGLDERDPTADVRLIEFCFALPLDALLRGGEPRLLARRALADRLPPEILEGRSRGYQTADWHERIGPADILAEIDACRGSAAAELLDLDAMEGLARSWPTGGWDRMDVIRTYRMALLRAVSVGNFLRGAGEVASPGSPVYGSRDGD